MGIIGFLESLVILIGFSLPACYVGGIMGEIVGLKLWEERRRKSISYTNTETPML